LQPLGFPHPNEETVVRLTLRTLLAYLDDTLEPAETKVIGQKVAESDAAQELIARIKQVTRRRRLTTPPATGPNSFEPNTVADYLDNTLPPEQVSEVEKVCLESDVHLAEIAAAHQIPTLVLGQPALVPPTAKQRMYALVHGRKAARPRAAATAATANGAAAADADARAEEDETLLLGLPLYRRQAAMRWLLPLAALLLIAVIGLAIWQAMPNFGNGTPVAQNNDDNSSPAPPPPPDSGREPQSTGKEGNTGTPPSGGTPNGNGGSGSGSSGASTGTSIGGTLGGPGSGTPPQPNGPHPVVRPDKPSTERQEVGRYAPQMGIPSVLVSRTVASDDWHIVKSDRKSEGKVFSTDLLVSLPGYKSDVRLDSGVGLMLWGSTYEFLSAFLESAVVLHAPPKGLDADLTLDRGAVLLTNHNDKKAEVRVRFLDQVWDMTLEDPDTEVGVALLSRHVLPFGSDAPPRADGFLLIRKGRASVHIRPWVDYPPLEPAREGRKNVPLVIFWDSDTKGAQRPVPVPPNPQLQMLVGVFDDPQKRPNALPREVQDRIADTQAALDGVSKQLSGPGKIETMLVVMLQPGETKLLNAVLAVRALGALDAIADLIDLLDNNQGPPILRGEAISTLRHWIGRNATQEERLYDPKTMSGYLTKGGKFRASEAAIIMELLHTPSDEQLNSPDTWAYLIDKLKHDKLAIRELAFFHLRRWVPEWTEQKLAYNPTDSKEALQAAFKRWKAFIPDGMLPPTQIWRKE